MAADGPFHRFSVEWCHASAAPIFTDECHARALLRPDGCGDTYLRHSLSGKRRKELKLQPNRLAELGNTEFHLLETAADVPLWIENFLNLGASGWKGR